MMKFIDELKKEELSGKKVLLRTDFDVPVVSGRIDEDFRIKAQKETIDYLLSAGSLVVMMAHISAINSFEPVVSQLGEILGYEVILLSHNDFETGSYKPEAGKLYLLDNIRQNEGEEKNDESFARSLSKGFDLYVNNAFAVSHREHASVSAVTKLLSSYGGFLIRKETGNLSRALNEPSDGKTLILGGAKIATKLPVINNFYDKAEKILVGGALANNFFFQIFGVNVGSSLIDNNIAVKISGNKIILPEDILIAQDKKGEGGASVYPVKSIEKGEFIADIGPKSAKKFADIIGSSKMVIWNGPLGYYEVEKFSHGTNIVAKAIASSKAESIIGGGDSISAVHKLGLLDKFGYVSTGGGAMLEFLAGNRLPGLEALGYYS